MFGRPRGRTSFQTRGDTQANAELYQHLPAFRPEGCLDAHAAELPSRHGVIRRQMRNFISMYPEHARKEVQTPTRLNFLPDTGHGPDICGTIIGGNKYVQDIQPFRQKKE